MKDTLKELTELLESEPSTPMRCFDLLKKLDQQQDMVVATLLERNRAVSETQKRFDDFKVLIQAFMLGVNGAMQTGAK